MTYVHLTNLILGMRFLNLENTEFTSPLTLLAPSVPKPMQFLMSMLFSLKKVVTALKRLSSVVDITGIMPKNEVCALFSLFEKYFTHMHSNLVTLASVDSSINNEYFESF